MPTAKAFLLTRDLLRKFNCILKFAHRGLSRSEIKQHFITVPLEQFETITQFKHRCDELGQDVWITEGDLKAIRLTGLLIYNTVSVRINNNAKIELIEDQMALRSVTQREIFETAPQDPGVMVVVHETPVVTVPKTPPINLTSQSFADAAKLLQKILATTKSLAIKFPELEIDFIRKEFDAELTRQLKK